MKIAYLLDSTILCGGVKVVFRQAEALIKLGNDVVISSPDSYPEWFESKSIPFERKNIPDEVFLNDFDWIIGTSPTHLTRLYDNSGLKNRLIHLVQGYESDYSEGKPYAELIEKAYSLPIPKITVSERLAQRLGRLYPGNLFISAGQGIEHHLFFPDSDNIIKKSDDIDRVFLIGPLSISVKQIHLGLLALKQVKKKYPKLKIIRISTEDTKEKEEVIAGKIDKFYIHIKPEQVGGILRTGTGIFFSPSDPGEGFGLPAIEAMACGIPAVLTDIPSYRSFSDTCDYGVFVPHDNIYQIAEGINKLISDKLLRSSMVQKGIQVAAQYSYENVAERLEKIINEAGKTGHAVSG